jgi:hypothetical protein
MACKIIGRLPNFGGSTNLELPFELVKDALFSFYTLRNWAVLTSRYSLIRNAGN